MSNPNNMCSFIGRLTKTPELHKTNTGKSVTSFTLAVDGSRPDKNGTWPVSFIDFVAWGARAEGICNSWKQGDLVKVDGELRHRAYTDKDGKKHVVAEIVVDARRKLVTAGRNTVPADPAPDYSCPPPPSDADFQEMTDEDSELPF